MALVTVEQLVDGCLLDDPARAGAVLPSLYVGAIALAPQGSRPLAFGDAYGADAAFLSRYAERARSEYLVSPAKRGLRSTSTATWRKPANARRPGK